MFKVSLRNASVFCLAIWAAIWLVFGLIRISALDIRVIPGIGPIMLVLLASVFLAPLAALTFAGAAILRQPDAPANWFAIAAAIAVLFGQGLSFAASGWL